MGTTRMRLTAWIIILPATHRDSIRKNIYDDGKLMPEATIKKYLTVQSERTRQVSHGHMFTDEYFDRQYIVHPGFNYISGDRQ